MNEMTSEKRGNLGTDQVVRLHEVFEEPVVSVD
jgi:hypothetical protein